MMIVKRRQWVQQLAAVVLSLLMTSGQPAWAQTSEPEGTSQSGSARRQVATIIMAGLGGAILGLSTLSFYGRPQDHLSNIAMGFGIGIIGGVIFVTYNAATNPRDFYGTRKEDAVLWREPTGPVALNSTRLGVEITW